MENKQNIARYIKDFDAGIVIMLGLSQGNILHEYVLNSDWKAISTLIEKNSFISQYDDWNKCKEKYPEQEQIDVGFILEKIHRNICSVERYIKQIN